MLVVESSKVLFGFDQVKSSYIFLESYLSIYSPYPNLTLQVLKYQLIFGILFVLHWGQAYLKDKHMVVHSRNSLNSPICIKSFGKHDDEVRMICMLE